MDKLQAIKKGLKNGDIKKLVRITGYTAGYISKVLSGIRTCELIVDAAEKLAEANNAKIGKRLEEIISDEETK